VTAARTNWNFEFARTAKIFNTKVHKPYEKNVNNYYQRLLAFVIFFILNAFINVYNYFVDV